MKSRTWIILLVMLLLFVSTNSASALKNPSAVYCKELGYEYITATIPEGGQRGFCVLPDNQIVDAWDFLEGKVGQEYSYCKKKGYEIKTIEDSEVCSGIFSYECAVCILEDGTEVEVTELMNLSFIESVCGDGTCGLPENFETCPEDCPSGELDEYCDGFADGKCDPDCEETGEYDPDCQAPAPTSSFLLIALAVVIIIIGVITVSVILLRRRKRG
jgi:putative hemolysin